jgi:integrase
LCPSDSDVEKILNGIRFDSNSKPYKKIFEECLILLLIKTGIRCDEAYNIRLRDIDLANRTLFIRKGKGNKQRTIALTNSACNTLNEFLNKRRDIV